MKLASIADSSKGCQIGQHFNHDPGLDLNSKPGRTGKVKSLLRHNASLSAEFTPKKDWH